MLLVLIKQVIAPVQCGLECAATLTCPPPTARQHSKTIIDPIQNFGWGHHREGVRLETAGRHPGVSVNDLTDPERTDALSGNAALSGVPVEVRPVAAESRPAGVEETVAAV